jgi:hypothetical protein
LKFLSLPILPNGPKRSAAAGRKQCGVTSSNSVRIPG